MKGKQSEDLKLIAIKTKDKVYISDNVTDRSYHNTYIQYYLFDGVEPKKTFRSDWFEIPAIPAKVEEKIPRQVIRTWYELRKKHYNTGLPKTLRATDFEEGAEYESVYGLYEIKNEYDEGGVQEVPFQLSVIEELDEFTITRYDFQLQHSILDRITTHPVLLTLKPCSLSREESYKIIREHIKRNIDKRYASITSDYDFCFTVTKRLSHEPEEYRVNVGKRKPKYETRFRRERGVIVFEMAPKAYSQYPIIEPFTGKNEEDLKRNIQEFLDDIMTVINKPIIECKHCSGTGVQIEEAAK